MYVCMYIHPGTYRLASALICFSLIIMCRHIFYHSFCQFYTLMMTELTSVFLQLALLYFFPCFYIWVDKDSFNSLTSTNSYKLL